jgi:hypothetical protein
LGLFPAAASDAWLDAAVSAYLTAGEYLGFHEEVHGRTFDHEVWLDALVRLYPRDAYVNALAVLNRATLRREFVEFYRERFLALLAPGVRVAAQAALRGGTDGTGMPRWFLARQLTLRAMRFVLTAEPTVGVPDPQAAGFLEGVDVMTAAILLTHLVGDALTKQRPQDGPTFGRTAESLAMEMVCNQVFNEPKDIGGILGRVWSLWYRFSATADPGPFAKAPLELLQEATGLELGDLLAIAFAYWVKSTEDRLGGPARIDAYSLVKLPKHTVDTFLALFSTSLDDLAPELEVCEQPWQMLPLQSRPLLREGDTVVILDESFFWEAVTTGLFWRISDHVRKGEPTAWEPWTRVYADMVEQLAEEQIKGFALPFFDGKDAFFTEEDIRRAFSRKGFTPPNTDAGVDFGDAVVLFEVVNANVSLAARSGSLTDFEKDVQQMVLKKAGQLDGTAKLLLQNPQPPASPLTRPPAKVFPVVVNGNPFPINPVTRNYVEDKLRSQGKLQDPRIQRLAVIDLEELESCLSLARQGTLLPELLNEWLSGPYGKGTLSTYLSSVIPGKLERPEEIAAPLREFHEALPPRLNIEAPQPPASGKQ